MCQNNMMLESVLKEHEGTLEGMLDRLTLVDGVSVYELDQRLEQPAVGRVDVIVVAADLRQPGGRGRRRRGARTSSPRRR